MKFFTLIFTVFCLGNLLFAQDQSLGFPTGTDTLPKVQNTLNFASKPGKLSVYKDERITKIEDFVRTGEGSIEGVKIDGYRVLIFFDMSKTVVEQQKAYFLSMYNQHKAYVDYMAPNYRVRVGNFRTELEAEKLKQEILPLFPTAIVVSDKIQLPDLNAPATNP
ncbi:MAG: hypothetical protein HYZ14_09095 [Bacteroidetes bacterium]|nr:hypothetical protein [Bacteroidota bacterium]